jgi:hypothetical protein
MRGPLPHTLRGRACRALPPSLRGPIITDETLPPDIPDDAAGRDWEAVAHDYAAGALSVAAICAAHSLTRATLYHRAKIDGWPLRRPGRRRSRADLAKRLLGALELKMTRFENRMADSAASATAADSERDARTLNTLVRLFEKLKGLGLGEAATRRARPAKSAPAPAEDSSVKDAHDADALRGELARRLEKLRGQLGG